MKKVILFNGPPRSGKDSATKYALDFLGLAGKHYRFAAPLKNAVHKLFGLAADMETFDSVKEIPNEAFFSMSPREAYIWMSEECAKPKFGKDFFTRVAVNAVKSFGSEFVVISDCGFREEVEGMIEAFGAEHVVMIHLYRDGKTFTNPTGTKDSRDYVKDVGCQEFTIENNGSLYDLERKVILIIEAILGAK